MKRKSIKLISFLMAASLLIGTPAQAVFGQEQDTEIVTEDIQEEELKDTEEATEEEPEIFPEENIEEELQETEIATEESIEDETEETTTENMEIAEDETEIFPEESIEDELQETEEMKQDEVEDNLIYNDYNNRFEKDGLLYCLKDDNTIILLGITQLNDNKKVVIPERIDGYPVTEIEEAAFYNRAVQAVVFPSTLKKIGKQAFMYSDLRSFSFTGDETVEVGEAAFANTSMEE